MSEPITVGHILIMLASYQIGKIIFMLIRYSIDKHCNNIGFYKKTEKTEQEYREFVKKVYGNNTKQ